MLVALGGAFGSVARYVADNFIGARLGTGFPWGIFIVNVSGSFLIGVVSALVGSRLPGWAGPLLVVGFLGGYTTFSTYSNDNLKLVMSGELGAAAANALGQVALGLIAVYLGLVVARAFGGT